MSSVPRELSLFQKLGKGVLPTRSIICYVAMSSRRKPVEAASAYGDLN